MVVKWEATRDASAWLALAPEATARLAQRDYPAPSYVRLGRVAGGVYSVQERLPGSPPAALDTALLLELIELNGVQAGLVEDLVRGPAAGGPGWADRVVQDLRGEGRASSDRRAPGRRHRAMSPARPRRRPGGHEHRCRQASALVGGVTGPGRWISG